MADVVHESVGQLSGLVEGVAKMLVADPAAVRLHSTDIEGETTLRLVVAPDDLGIVLGKNGRTARALRTLVSAAGTKLQGRFLLDIRSDA